ARPPPPPYLPGPLRPSAAAPRPRAFSRSSTREVPMPHRILIVSAATACAAACAPGASAARLAKGNCEVWIGLNGNRSHILTPPASLADIGEENEVGLHLAGSYFLCDAWAAVLSGGFDVGRQKFEPSAGTASKF